MHEYPIEGLKMPTFVTNDVQMVIEVNFAPGDNAFVLTLTPPRDVVKGRFSAYGLPVAEFYYPKIH